MNLQKMMQQAQQMQTKMAQMQQQLEQQEIEGSAGGGAVTIRISGKHKILKVAIDDSLMKPEEKEMLEDLIAAAHNDAREKMDAVFSDQMGRVTQGLNLPPGLKLPF